jgi:hypothetical protein
MKSSCHFFFDYLGMPAQFSNSNSPVSVLHCTTLYSTNLISAANALSVYRRGTDMHHRKHMPRDRYPLLLCDNAHRHAARELYGNGPCADTKKTLLQYFWPHVCCGRCLAVRRYVTIRYPVSPKLSETEIGTLDVAH